MPGFETGILIQHWKKRSTANTIKNCKQFSVTEWPCEFNDIN